MNYFEIVARKKILLSVQKFAIADNFSIFFVSKVIFFNVLQLEIIQGILRKNFCRSFMNLENGPNNSGP